MSTEIERRVAKSIVASKSVSGAAGKGLVLGGTTVLAVTFLAALIPFVGVTVLALAMIGLGFAFWE